MSRLGHKKIVALTVAFLLVSFIYSHLRSLQGVRVLDRSISGRVRRIQEKPQIIFKETKKARLSIDNVLELSINVDEPSVPLTMLNGNRRNH